MSAEQYLGKLVKVTIDRPLGSNHPTHNFTYEVNYGFVPNSRSGDGEELDAYVLGIDTPLVEFEGRCVAIIKRTNDNDDKLILIPNNSSITDEEIERKIHFQEKWFPHTLIRSQASKIFRYSIKAIIIKDGKILVESCDYGNGRFCKLPGGGHQWGETMTEALIRECKEELCLDVTPKRLLFARDYIAKNHIQPIDTEAFHQAELMFECEVKDFSTLACGDEPDSDDQQILWIAIDDLATHNFYPRSLIPHLKNLNEVKETIILGDAN